MEPLASNVYVNLVRKNEVVSSQAVAPGAGSYQFAAPSDTDYTIVLSDSPPIPLPRPRSTGVSRARRPAFSAPIPKARTHRTSA